MSQAAEKEKARGLMEVVEKMGSEAPSESASPRADLESPSRLRCRYAHRLSVVVPASFCACVEFDECLRVHVPLSLREFFCV